ncbi:hypothetical protein, partial [Microbacterium paraoxydans]|uniref:hypothetical protein n=1 Tax=Microbacterium paraoxydans TaxID=199592 RepID=UPI003013D4A4
GVVIGVTPFEWDVRVSSKEDPGGHADVYWPGSLHHSTGHYSRRPTVRDRLAIPEVHAEDAAPPVEAGISWEGESMSVDEVIAQLPEMGRSARNRTVKGITVVLSWLQLHPGVTWQQRWVSSKIEMEDDWSNIVAAWWNEKSGEKLRGEKVVVGVTWIITVGSVRPGYGWLTRSSKHLRMFPETIIKVRDPETRQVIFDAIALDAGNRSQERLERLAQKAIAQVMAHTGKTRIRDIVPEDFIEARSHERRQGLHLTNGTAYDAMSRAGLLPEGAPERFVNLRRKTQPSIEEVVDRTGIKNRDVRNFFVDYMRAHIDMTHATMAGLTTQLVKTYWVEIERLAPGINSMEVSPQLFEQWLERAQTIQYGTSAGKKRAEISPLLTAIRRLYVDINDWANADPERYGKFAAPNPVAPGVTKLGAKTAHRRRAWSHARTRQRQPLLPALVRHVDEGRRVSRRLLDLAAAE